MFISLLKSIPVQLSRDDRPIRASDDQAKLSIESLINAKKADASFFWLVEEIFNTQ